MRTITLIIFFIGLLCFGASEVFAQCACSRKNLTASEEFKAADIVFVGEVLEIKRTAPDKQNRFTETVVFKVKSAWKEDLDEFVTITNEIYGCVNGFKEKMEWLIYAHKKPNDQLGTGCCCSRTRLLSKATEDLKDFERNGEKQTTVLKKRDQKMNTVPNKLLDARRKQQPS